MKRRRVVSNIPTYFRQLDDEEKIDSLKRKLDSGQRVFENVDAGVWFRNCEKEVRNPRRGKSEGTIPTWLDGVLMRNGPGSWNVGEEKFDHLFDCSALLHRFKISHGAVTYSCRFIKSKSYTKNQAAGRIVVTGFGTRFVPDPCASIFRRISTLFKPGSDNTMVSVYPIQDQVYALGDSNYMHRIDPNTLETLQRIDLASHLTILHQTSHPITTHSDGKTYNLGVTLTPTGPRYCILQLDQVKDNRIKLITSVPVRWRFHPGYMHTFAITSNYYIIVEQPLSISVPTLLRNSVTNQPLATCLKFFENQNTIFHILSRTDGSEVYRFTSDAFFYLHIINAYEDNKSIVVDICCYRNPDMLECMYREALESIHSNPRYAQMFRARPLRFRLNLESKKRLKPKIGLARSPFKTSKGPNTSRKLEQKVRPTLLCDVGCETPRVNDKYQGRKYGYFYAISADIDRENPGTLIKVNIQSNTCTSWSETGVYPSEPVFVPTPNSKQEDEGILLSVLLWSQNPNLVTLLILSARTMQEMARSNFTCPSPVPKCLHGYFLPAKRSRDVWD